MTARRAGATRTGYDSIMDTWEQTGVVGEGGHISVEVPDLRAGEHVDVLVRRRTSWSVPATRPMGLLKSKVWMSDDFDAPLDEFAESM